MVLQYIVAVLSVFRYNSVSSFPRPSSRHQTPTLHLSQPATVHPHSDQFHGKDVLYLQLDSLSLRSCLNQNQLCFFFFFHKCTDVLMITRYSCVCCLQFFLSKLTKLFYRVRGTCVPDLFPEFFFVHYIQLVYCIGYRARVSNTYGLISTFLWSLNTEWKPRQAFANNYHRLFLPVFE